MSSSSVVGNVLPPCRLNVGCGRDVRPGWINLDRQAHAGIDVVCHLDRVRQTPIPLPDNSVNEFMLSHVLEHIDDSLALMEDLWRLATANASMTIRVPHGGSDDAWEDPTHVRAYFPGSFGYYSQPYYWRADYGYRGDWQPDKIYLVVDEARYAGLSFPQMLQKIQTERNSVREMVCICTAIKPQRPAARSQQTPPKLFVANSLGAIIGKQE